ncbi:TIGR03621 family F420-dependent LLM class oxidoreductase [Streptomyces sp. RFCAC02]|uniref:TIGR03621 family F420-dependent LLM class oxidoreductase n=1 Tax=Streptomyces sp. RFCAC02 TaxID=2499143 RepID=UPI00101F9B31|nr:TIGR03621 family F420-dependent LLM class oxidoreductase [Streptomyces sp. RFCAC02]
MTHHPFRFAVTATGDQPGADWPGFARRAEDLGYDLLLVTDHVSQGLAPLPALAAAAAVTTRIGLGTYVLGNDLRNPVLLAQEAATVDALSGGRLTLGLGAGWLPADYRSTGIPFAPGAERLARLTETVTVVDELLTTGSCHHEGRHHTVHVDDFAPRRPDGTRPDLLLGGARRGALALAARHADTVSLLPRTTAEHTIDRRDTAPDALDRKIAHVREAAGPRFDHLRLNHVLWECMVLPDPRPVLDVFARAMDETPEQVADNPAMLIGSATSAAEQVERRRERWGLSTVTVPAGAMEAMAPVVAALSGK